MDGLDVWMDVGWMGGWMMDGWMDGLVRLIKPQRACTRGLQ